jgi:hypothetical protein
MEKGYTPAVSNGPILPKGFSTAMQAFSVVSAMFGAVLILWPFFFPARGPSAVPWWAWTLTPLTARVAGGWYLASATLQFTLSRQQYADTTGPALLGLMLVTATQLIGAFIHMDAFNGSPLFIALYLINSSAVFVFALITFLRYRTAFTVVPSKAAV